MPANFNTQLVLNRFSNVTSTGPKGILKEDVIRHITEQNLQPVELITPSPAAPPAEVALPKEACVNEGDKTKPVMHVKR